jgi:bifunctional non-homologous end joining protein LigD
MLAVAARAPTGEGWAMEVKWDGIRAQVVFDRRSVGVRSRRGRSCADEFPELQELGGVLSNRRVVLDGELVCLGADGKPDFAASAPA